jgi:hypothetical protein
MTTNNCDSNKFIAPAPESETPAHVRIRPKPIIRVRTINPKPKPDPVLLAIAELIGNIKNLEELISKLQELISKLLAQQHYAAIRERERRW